MTRSAMTMTRSTMTMTRGSPSGLHTYSPNDLSLSLIPRGCLHLLVYPPDDTPPRSPQNARGTENTAQLARAFEIHRRCMAQQSRPSWHPTWVTLKELEDQFKKGADTVRRCIGMMREELGLPIDYVIAKGGYGYLEKVTNFPLTMISEEELNALVHAQEMLSLCSSPEEEKVMRRVMRKMLRTAGPEFEDAAVALKRSVGFFNIGFNAPARVDPQLRQVLTRAAMDRVELHLDHRSARPGAVPKRVRLQPLFVAWVNQAWYLWHDDAETGERRKYALSRISNVARTETRFVPRPFDADKEVGEAFGLYDDDTKVQVIIRFTANVTTFITERDWHSSQHFLSLPDGGVELRMMVPHTPELEAFVLRWAGEVQVIAPADLVAAIRKRGEALVAMHRAAGPPDDEDRNNDSR